MILELLNQRYLDGKIYIIPIRETSLIKDNVEITVRRKEFFDFFDILPVEKRDGKYCFYIPNGEGKWERVELEYGQSFDEYRDKILCMPEYWLKLLYEELVKIFGDIKQDATTQKLEATQYHLEDMRKLVHTAYEIKE